MSHLQHGKHPKQEFQVERLAFFSDAVFAIAITLLVIEFKVPHVTLATTRAEIIEELQAIRFPFMATVLSFLLIAVNWVRHHLLFKHIHDYNKPILVTSLAILLPTIFFPFTTAFYAESVNNMNVFPVALQLFLLNNVAIGVITYYLYWLVTVKYPDMAYPMSAKDRRVFSVRLLWMTIGMALMFVASFISMRALAFAAALMVLSILYDKFKKEKTKHA